jgi:predicted metal-dependent phosphoesterase TrpH
VGEAVRRGVRVLAVTDHDSVDGVGPAALAARGHPLEIVAGIEINTDGPGGEIHVLGYFLDHEAPWLQDLLREFRAERAARVHRIAARLAELGHPIDADEVFALVQEGSAGRPHVAQIMVRRGYVSTVREAFDRFLGAGKPAYVGHRKVVPREACEIIRRAGGLAVVAHPGFHDDPARMIRELAATGLLDGVECYYAEHSPELTTQLLGLCRELGLAPTGGSDFHGPRVRAAMLGQPSVPWDAWEALRRRAGR